MSSYLSLSGLSPTHHLVYPLTWIHLLLLPIHQSAWAHPPCVPRLPGACHSAHHTHTRAHAHIHTHPLHLPSSPPLLRKQYGDNKEDRAGPSAFFTRRGVCGVHIWTYFPEAKTVLCHPASFPSPGTPQPPLCWPQGLPLEESGQGHAPPAKNVQVVPEEIIGQERVDVCTRMFMAELFVIAKDWKQPKCPTVGAA